MAEQTNSGTTTTGAPNANDTSAANKTREKTIIVADRAALDAATPPKGYRKYIVVIPATMAIDGKTEFFGMARDPQKAAAEVAERAGFKVSMIGGKREGKTEKKVEDLLSSMTPEKRAEILAKYLANNNGGAARAASEMTQAPMRQDSSPEFDKTTGTTTGATSATASTTAVGTPSATNPKPASNVSSGGAKSTNAAARSTATAGGKKK